MARHTNTHTETVRYEHIRHAKTNTQMTHWDRNDIYTVYNAGRGKHCYTRTNADKRYGCARQKCTTCTEGFVCHGNTMWGMISRHLFNIKLQILSFISKMERLRQRKKINRKGECYKTEPGREGKRTDTERKNRWELREIIEKVREIISQQEASEAELKYSPV